MHACLGNQQKCVFHPKNAAWAGKFGTASNDKTRFFPTSRCLARFSVTFGSIIPPKTVRGADIGDRSIRHLLCRSHLRTRRDAWLSASVTEHSSDVVFKISHHAGDQFGRCASKHMAKRLRNRKDRKSGQTMRAKIVSKSELESHQNEANLHQPPSDKANRGNARKNSAKSKKCAPSRSLQIESLESRLAMTGAATLTVFVNSQPVALPANIGKFADNSTAVISTTDANGHLTFNDSATRTLGDFFQIWRTNAGLAGNNANANLSATQLMGNSANATSTVQMFVNGQVASDFANHVLVNGENIVLAFGSNPIVSLNSNFGPIIIELFETTAPGTVNNFLNYVNRSAYNNSVFHRVDDNFVIQGGGFNTSSTTFTATSQFTAIATDPPIQNQPGRSNTRRTVAMAKSSDPNSATSQFFVNLSNDNNFLDSPSNSGGFTAFGQVLDMTAADTISNIPVRTTNPSPFGELPVTTANLLPVIQAVTGKGDMTGTVFTDANNNGLRDTSEAALSGVTVFVDANGNSTFDTSEQSVISDANGQYLLQVLPGSRSVRAVVPTGKTLSLPSSGGYTRTIEIGRTVSGLSFGVGTSNGSGNAGLTSGFAGNVYVDTNANGTLDTGESGIPGVMITLSGLSSNTPFVRTVITGNDGVYRFDNVPSGTFSIAECQPSAMMDGTDSASITGAASANDQFSNIAFTSGQKLTNVNFGELRVLPEFVNIAWFFVSASSNNVTPFRQVVARGEAINGDTTFAATILAATSETPNVGSAAPVASSDSFTVNAGNSLNITAANGVLKNDSDSDGDPISSVIVSSTTHGSLSLRSDGSFTYVPVAGFSGSDSFTYAATDGVHASALVTASILVVGTNGVPTAANDTYTTNKGTPLTIANADGVLKNDVDPDGSALTAQIVANPSHGTVTLSAAGGFTYTPAAGYSGADSFTYRANDNTSNSNTATVNLTVLPPPTATADTFSVNENSPLSINAAAGVLSNDTNPDTGALSALLGTTTSHGTLLLNADGSFVYTPNANYFGPDTFTYKATKGTRQSETATATINVQSVNIAPLAVGNLYTVNEDTALTVTNVNGVLANDTDGDGDSLTATKVSDPTSGTVTFNSNGSFTYTPVANFQGNATFTYRANDANTSSSVATVTIQVTGVNDPPVAVADTYVVATNGVLNVSAALGVTKNDSDIDGDGLIATIRLSPLTEH